MRKDSTCCEFLRFHSLAYPPKILFSHLNKFASPCVPLKFFIVPSFLGSGNVPSKDSHGKTPMKLEPKLQDLVFVMWSPGNAHSTDFILFWNACFYFILECVVGERFLQDLHPWQSPPQSRALSESSPCSTFPCTGSYSCKARNLSLYIPLTVLSWKQDILRPTLDEGPGSNFLGTNLDWFEANWILELDYTLVPSPILGSPNQELSF
jgi:hypothetical protein